VAFLFWCANPPPTTHRYETSDTTEVAAGVYIVFGQQYLILFFTDSESSTMIDPVFNIIPSPLASS